MTQKQKREKPVERQRGLWDEERTRDTSVRSFLSSKEKNSMLTQRKGERKCCTDIFRLKEKKQFPAEENLILS